jgi:hypothetical protein
MKARASLTAVSAAYVVVVGMLFRHVPPTVFNLLLATVAAPLVRLLWAFARFSAQQHARRWARDIEKVHAPRARRSESVPR